MTAKFQLHCADAVAMMRALPDASVDMICTDIAYESLEKHRAKGTTTRLKVSDGSSNEWFAIFRNNRFREFFAQAYRIMKKDSHLYFFCDGETSRVAVPEGEKAKFTFWNEIVWVKTKGAVSVDTLDGAVRIGMGYHYRRSKEYILFFEKGKKRLNSMSVPDVLPCPPVMNGWPTEKPVDLLKILIGQSTLPGEIVLDPFMGSGSTGSAAMRLGRAFIGNDIKESSIELARRRLLGAMGTEATVVEIGTIEALPEPSAADMGAHPRTVAISTEGSEERLREFMNANKRHPTEWVHASDIACVLQELSNSRAALAERSKAPKKTRAKVAKVEAAKPVPEAPEPVSEGSRVFVSLSNDVIEENHAALDDRMSLSELMKDVRYSEPDPYPGNGAEDRPLFDVPGEYETTAVFNGDCDTGRTPVAPTEPAHIFLVPEQTPREKTWTHLEPVECPGCDSDDHIDIDDLV